MIEMNVISIYKKIKIKRVIPDKHANLAWPEIGCLLFILMFMFNKHLLFI